MDEQQREAFDEHDLETQRLNVRQSFDEIVTDIGIAMRDAHLTFPLGITIPSSGHAIVTVVSPGDPPDDEWEQASTIVQQVVGKRLGGIRLRSKHLSCAMVNATISGAEIT